MKKVTLTLMLSLLATVANAEILNISSNGATTSTTLITEVGKTYEIMVSGTFKFGDIASAQADAEWLMTTYTQPDWTEYHHDSVLPEDQLDLSINGQFVDWLDAETLNAHTFSPSHRYIYNLSGKGSAIDFRITDHFEGIECHFDNSGQLTVEVVPEPATLALLTLGTLALRKRR